MQLPNIPLVVLDTETTGFTPKVNRVIEFASMRTDGNRIVDTYEQLFSIDSAIPDEVQVLTRIRPEHLKGEPTFESLRGEIEGHIGADTLIVGQNVGFDINMLKGEGIDLSDRPWIDTSMLASLVFPELQSYSLGYMSAVLELHHEPVHRALGDVRATLEMLEKCWQRLLELPAEHHAELKRIFGRSAPGYQLLAEALPEPTATQKPGWLRMPEPAATAGQGDPEPVDLPKPEPGVVELIEEPLQADVLTRILHSAAAKTETTHWIGVKNLEATLRRHDLPESVRVLYPPFLLLEPEAAQAFSAQDVFTADEATLALKLLWYQPKTQGDLPIHGAEPGVWSAKLACTDDSPAYLQQFENLPSVMLLDHRQLLAFLADPSHTAHGALQPGAHVMIDDASMLEDTATKAYGWYCSVDTLRAAAEGHDRFTKFIDLLTIWIERTRSSQDIRYLTIPDLSHPDVRQLREAALELLEDDALPASVKRQVSHLEQLLQNENLGGRIAYIELRYNGQLVLHSVPERIGLFLQGHLYNAHSVSLLVPPENQDTLEEILPTGTDRSVRSDLWESSTPPFEIECPEGITLQTLLTDPPAGKTIILASSKRSIDDVFVRYAEALEESKVTLICQGFNGGISRTRAEFIAADEPALWLLTPWAYEGVDLPEGTVDTLCIMGLPFDHPAHAVFSKRAEHYRDPFTQYSLPRMLHRVFRLLRNCSSQGSKDTKVLFLDNRLHTKRYCQVVLSFLRHFGLV